MAQAALEPAAAAAAGRHPGRLLLRKDLRGLSSPWVRFRRGRRWRERLACCSRRDHHQQVLQVHQKARQRALGQHRKVLQLPGQGQGRHQRGRQPPAQPAQPRKASQQRALVRQRRKVLAQQGQLQRVRLRLVLLQVRPHQKDLRLRLAPHQRVSGQPELRERRRTSPHQASQELRTCCRRAFANAARGSSVCWCLPWLGRTCSRYSCSSPTPTLRVRSV